MASTSVKYDDGDSEKCVTSLPAELDVVPSDGMSECQLFANYHLFWVLHVLQTICTPQEALTVNV